MSGAAFINRVPELNALKALALKQRSAASVLLLRGPSGRGKSGIIDRLIETESSLVAVRVRISPRSGAERLGYISHIVHRIDEYAGRTSRFMRFQEFLSSSSNPALLRETASRMVSGVRSVFPPLALAVPLAQRVLNAEEYNAPAVVLKDKSLDLAALTGYLVAFMRTPLALIAIENIQQIDDRSLMVLTNAIQEAQSGLWVLEYTDYDVNAHPAEMLDRRVRDAGATVETIRLEPLPWPELREAADIGDAKGELLLAAQYSKSGGNLRDFFDARSLVREGSGDLIAATESSATALVLRSLSGAAAQVVCLLAMHDGQASVGLLRHALTLVAERGQFAERLDLDRELALLQDARILRRDYESVAFAHDSIPREIDALPTFARHKPIAAGAWLELYRRLRKRNDPFLSPAALSTSILYYSYYLGDDAELLTTLKAVASDAVQALAPDRLAAYVRLLFERIGALKSAGDARLHKLTHQIIATLYRIGDFENARRLLPFLKPESNIARYYDAAFATECGRPEDALAVCMGLLRELRLYPRNPLRLSVCLLELAALRSANRLEECLSRYKSLRESGSFDDPVFRAHLDLLSCVALPTGDAVPLLERAECAFVGQDSEFEANCARITLSQCLGDLGEIDKARAAITRVEQSRVIGETERYTAWTNRAALDLYCGDGASALELLKASVLVVSDRFSRLLILINLLIAHTLAGNRGAAQDVANLMQIMLDENDPGEPEIRRIAAFNLRFFLRRFGMESEADAVTKFAMTVESRINQPLWDYWFGRKAVAPAEYAFRMRYEYYPPMFAFWQVDLSWHLGNSE
jgi:hypothetical protein